MKRRRVVVLPAIRPLAVLLLLVLLAGALFPIAAHAAEGRACETEPTDEEITYGDLITCSVSPLGDSDVFRFQGTTGEQIIITATRPSGNVSPCIDLYPPSGGATPFATACNGTSITFTVQATLNETGLWTINIHDGGAPNAGPYTFVLDRLAPASPAAEPVEYGKTITGEINPLGDADLFIIGGGLGSTIAIQTAQTDGGVQPCIAVYDPDGVLVASDCHTSGNTFAITATIAKAGAHTVHIADRGNNDVGTFSLTLQCLAGDCPDLHTLTITAGPAGTPNPVKSASVAALDVTVVDSFSHALTYAWTAACPAALASNGAFSDASDKDPTWTAPENLTGVDQICTIQVTVDDGHGLTKIASYEQTVFPKLPPDITVTPLTLSFGDVPVGTTSAPQTVTVKNDGRTDDLVINTITITTGAASLFQKTADGCSNTTLQPGQSCTVSVTLSPLSTGVKSSKLSIPSNDPDENPVLVTLTGKGTSGAGLAPDIAVSPPALDFGNITVNATSPAQVITVQNEAAATANLTIKTITISTQQFQRTVDGCTNVTLVPGASCTISVVFKPTSTGAKSATLSIPSNDPDASENPVKVALAGTGTTGGGGGGVPDITVTPATLDFGSVTVNTVSAPQQVTVQNDGTADLLVKNITFTGTAFQKSSDLCSNTTLVPGGSCTLSIAFKPGSTGEKTSTLSIPSNDPDASENPAKVALKGTGVTGGGGGGAPDITVTPPTLEFGDVAVNTVSAPQTITIQNDGTADLLVKTITFTGTAFQKSSDACSNTTLVPGASCTVSMAFKPATTGAKASTLSIPSNDPDAGENPAKVALSGTGVASSGPPPDITVTPLTLDFGSVAVHGTSAPQTITISNDGAGDLLIKNISRTGTAFQITSDPCSNTTVAPGGSCAVSVTFTPGSTGAKTSTLSIPSNDPDSSENPAKVKLSGQGI